MKVKNQHVISYGLEGPFWVQSGLCIHPWRRGEDMRLQLKEWLKENILPGPTCDEKKTYTQYSSRAWHQIINLVQHKLSHLLVIFFLFFFFTSLLFVISNWLVTWIWKVESQTIKTSRWAEKMWLLEEKTEASFTRAASCNHPSVRTDRPPGSTRIHCSKCSTFYSQSLGILLGLIKHVLDLLCLTTEK